MVDAGTLQELGEWLTEEEGDHPVRLMVILKIDGKWTISSYSSMEDGSQYYWVVCEGETFEEAWNTESGGGDLDALDFAKAMINRVPLKEAGE